MPYSVDEEEREVLAIVDDWLSTTPEIFDDGEDEDEFVPDDFLTALLLEDDQ